MEWGASIRPPTSQSFSRFLESSGGRNSGAILLGKKPVAELVVWYQNIVDCGRSLSTDETQILAKRVSQKRITNGLKPAVSEGNSPRISRSKSMEHLIFQPTNSPASNGPSLSQARFISGRAISSPMLVESLAKRSARNLNSRDQLEARKTAATHPVKPEFQTDRPSFLLQTKRGRDQKNCPIHLHEDHSESKEAQLTRRSKMTPSTILSSGNALKKVNSCEKRLGTLEESSSRSVLPLQGYRTPVFPSVKERSALYSSQVATAATDRPGGLTQPAGGKEPCASCSKSVYSTERITVQNVPLHQACFCCHHCKRKLSLLNYTTFQGAFYCKTHYKLLAEAQERSQVDISCIHQKYPESQAGAQPCSRPEVKNNNNQTGRILMREKMQQRLVGLHPQTSRKLNRQPAKETMSTKKTRTSWPPLDKIAKHDRGSTAYGSGAAPIPLVLPTQNAADVSPLKTPKGKPTAEVVHLEKKPSQMSRVTFPKVSHCIKTKGRSGDSGILEKKQVFMAKSIPRAQERKEGCNVSQKVALFQADAQKLKREVPRVSPLTKPSPLHSFPFHSEARRTMKMTQAASTGVVRSDPSCLANASPGEKEQSGGSSDKGPGSVPKARVSSSTHVPKNGKQDLPETSKGNSLITLVLEEAAKVSHGNTEKTEGYKQSWSEPEGSLDLPELEGKKSNVIKHDKEAFGSDPDSVEAQLINEQGSTGHSGEEELYGKEAQNPEDQFYLQSHSEEIEIKHTEEMQQGRRPGGTKPQECSQNLQGTNPKSQAISPEGETNNGHPVSSSEVGLESIDVLPRNNLREAILSCHTMVPDHKNLEPNALPVQAAATKEMSLKKDSNADVIPSESQEDTFEKTTMQAFDLDHAVPIKELETVNTNKSSCMIAKQVTENADVDMNPQSNHGSFVEAIYSEQTTDNLYKKQSMNKKLGPLSVSKTQSSVSKQEPKRTKKITKPQAALVTLFGCSSDQGKSQKELKSIAKPSTEVRNKEKLPVLCSSNRPNPGNYKKEESPKVTIPTNDSDVGLQDSEEKMKTLPQDQFANVQCSPTIVAENSLSRPVGSLMKANSEEDITIQSHLNNQDLVNFPNLASLESHDVEREARNVSFSGTSSEDGAPLLNWDH